MNCAPKKVRKSRQTFQSVRKSVGIRADGHMSHMRALREVRKSIGDSVGTDVGMCADGHVSDMRVLRDVRNPSMILSVLYVGNAVGKPVGECGTIP